MYDMYVLYCICMSYGKIDYRIRILLRVQSMVEYVKIYDT